MPYKRRTKKSTKKLVTVESMKRYIDRQIEDKLDYGYMTTTYSLIGNAWIELDLLSMLAQSITLNTRIGNTIRIKSIQVRGVLKQGSNGGVNDDAYNVTRICLTKIETTDLTPFTTAAYTIDSMILADSGCTGLKKVLYDKYITMQTCAGAPGVAMTPTVKSINIYKRFKTPWKVTFSNNNQGTNNYRLFLSMISDSVAAPSPGFVCGYWKVVYEDA